MTLQATAKSVIHILLVEDEPKLRQSLAEGLELEAWHVTSAADGGEAWRQLQTHVFDLIVLDRMLPDGDALKLVRRLREASRNDPVLLVTARASSLDQEEAWRAGVTDFLAKPFSYYDLLARSRAVLSHP